MTQGTGENSEASSYRSYLTAIIVFAFYGAVLFCVVLGPPFDMVLLFVVVMAMMLGFSYAPRFKRYILVNRLAYIVLVGSVIGGVIWMFFYALGTFRNIVRIVDIDEHTVGLLSVLVTLSAGAVAGELIGRHKKYKGPA